MNQIIRQTGPAAPWPALAAGTSPLHAREFVAAPRWHLASRRAASWLRRGRDAIRLWQERSRGRQQLMMLDEHVLRDIGITRLQAEAEAHKPFWRP
ncbi:MAG: DUF1127 domain-containing protein [Geminicoccaceae bacterium]